MTGVETGPQHRRLLPVTTGVETGAPLTAEERKRIAERIGRLKVDSDKKWARCEQTASFDEVLTPLRC